MFLAHETFDIWPKLAGRFRVAALGEWPTPVEPLPGVERAVGASELYVKRDDLTSSVYGGNKVRTLEALFGMALAAGARRIFSTGAFGSNHAVATVLHAPRAGLEPGAILYPQPHTGAALENLRVIVARASRFVALPHWSLLPFGIAWTRYSETREGRAPIVMLPGGATPHGALGYVGAAFELAAQVQRRELPRPERVVLPVGSTCTTAGLLAGFALAARRGIGFVDEAGRPAPPEVVAVRVTPRIVTSVHRIVGLSLCTLALLRSLTEDESVAATRAELAARLRVEGRFLGRGYGYPTDAGARACATFHDASGLDLDPIYSGKAAAAFLDLAPRTHGPTLFWATKSSAPLPDVTLPEKLPRGAARWIEHAAHSPAPLNRR